MFPRPSLAFRALAHAATALLALLCIDVGNALAGLPEVVERVKRSVVSVGTFEKMRSPAYLFRGTGFVVGDGTLVATNAHVVRGTLKVENGETLMVLVQSAGAHNPEARTAKVFALDPEHDVALLRIGGTPLPAVTLGDSDKVREGQSIAFTGFPIGQLLGFHATTHRGIVSSLTPIAIPVANSSQLDSSAVGRLKGAPVTLFQLDATTYAGHSGSPLYDENSGEVIGIVNMGFLRGMKDPTIGQVATISFAVPSRFLRELIAKTPP
jgi:S1-C subfamily serine protease